MADNNILTIPKKTAVRAYSPKQVVNKKRVLYEFSDKFMDSFGKPEKCAKWIVWGQSFSGKSSLMFQICNYLCEFGRIDYNSIEEGNTQTVADKIIKHGLHDKDGKFRILDRVPVDDMMSRLKRRNSAEFAVIDSIQHSRMNKETYLKMADTIKNKSLLFVSHAKGLNPSGDLAVHIRYDVDIKIHTVGFVAHVDSRYGGCKPFIIWEEGAKKYWGKKYGLVRDGKYWPGLKK